MKITGKEKLLLALVLGAAISTSAQAGEDRIDNGKDDTAEIVGDSFSGFTLTGNSAYGAAVANAGIITIVSGSTFSANYAATRGGALYNDGSNTNIGIINSITNSEFSQNGSNPEESESFTAYGGAICNYGGTIESIEETTFSENTAQNSGGAIYNTSSSATITSIKSSSFSENKTTNNSSSNTYGGGAIYNAVSIGSIEGSTFTENTSARYGGAIFNNGGSITSITGTVSTENGETTSTSIFSGNSAAYGGAISNYNNGSIQNISGTLFTGNTATSGGGAIYNTASSSSYTATIDSITGTIFTGNSTTNGGAIYNSGTNASITSISETTFTENTASTSGGAIYINSGSIGSIEGTSFTGNTATTNGGAIYNSGTIGNIKSYEDTSSGSTTVTQTTFEGNTATSGGAIYNTGTIGSDGGGISDTTFTKNIASSNGGAIYNTGTITSIIGTVTESNGEATSTSSFFSGNTGTSGGAIYSSSSIGSIEGTIFDSNEATSGSGGAIYNTGTIGSDEGGISGTSFTGNTASSNGGAIYNTGTITSITGTVDESEASSTSNFSGNSGTSGGAIYNYDGSIGSIEGTIFDSNTATNGGAIYNYDLTSKAVINSISGTSFDSNKATTNGGAIYNYYGTISSIEGSSFDSNKATRDGGAIYNNYGTITTIEDCTFSGNEANADGGTSQYYGGAIYTINGGISTITGTLITDGDVVTGSTSTFTENTATSGGAIYISGTRISSINGTIFDSNKASSVISTTTTSEQEIDAEGNVTTTTTVSTSSNGGDGGAIYSTGTIGADDGGISATVFKGNTADGNGGAIFNSDTITSIKNTTFDSNKATGSTNTTTTTITIVDASGTTISTETTTSTTTTSSYGGAIYNYTGATISSIENTTFTENTAATSGGAIGNVSNATITKISDSVFEKNSAIMGGAITNEGILGDIVNSEFTGNSATSMGGAIYITGSATMGTITDSTFSGNTANGYGGAIYTRADSFEGIVNSTFKGNISAADGGALYNGDGTINSIAGVTFEGNEANNGGAIRTFGTIETITSYDDNGKTIYTTFTENAASTSGGAIYNYSNANIGDIQYVIFTGNTAGVSGGAIVNAVNANIGSITGGTFSGNEATNTDGTVGAGGAIYNYDGATIGSISGVEFTGNEAGQDGGAIYNFWETTSANGEGIIGDITGSTFTENKSSNYGGAIFNRGYIGLEADGVTVTGGISHSTFTGNESGRGGAIYNGTQRDESSQEGTFDSIIASIDTCTFEGNIADKYGGAIYNYDDGYILDIADNKFIENKALNGNGGAIENAEAGSYIGNISNNYFYKNEVVNGEYGGGAIYNEGIIDKFGENVFEENTSGTFGGAIYNHGGTISDIIGDEDTTMNVAIDDSTGTITITTGTFTSSFTGNTSNRGGAIYNTGYYDDDSYEELRSAGTIASITYTSFEKNVARNYGGAIYNYHGGEIGNIAYNYFGENEADSGNGGAIENAEADAVIANISGNIFYGNKVTESDHGGGAIYNEGIIKSITGGNYFIANTSGNFGGAIYNNGGLFGGTEDLTIDSDADVDVDEIEGSISGNYFYANSSGRGGAIYNTDTRTLITTEIDSEGKATATAEILDLDGKILDDEGNAYDGTIKNINNNTFAYNTSTHMGGAIYNYHGGEIGSISGNTFTSNEAQDGNGGAVENAEFDATIGDMVSNTFEGNSAVGNGGAIYNQGTIGIQRGTSEENPDTVTGGISDSTFTGNTAANGGAIYNNYGTARVYILASDNSTEETETIVGINVDNEGKVTYTDYDVSLRTIEGAGAIGDITGSTFTGNKAVGTKVDDETYTGDAKGGAIYNASGTITDGDGTVYTCTINSITDSTFTNNSAISADGAAMGGAIYNAGTIGSIELASLSNNYAEGVTEAAGGAIYNEDENTPITISGSITDNSATASNGDAAGGAIYTAGDVNVIADGTTIYIQNNYANDDDNAIYMAGTKDGQALTFNLSGGSSIYLYDNVQGEGNYDIIISGESTDDTFYLWNDVNAVSDASPTSIKLYDDTIATTNNADLSVGSVTLNTINNDVHIYYTNSFTVTDNFNMVADVDLYNEKMDRFVTNNNGEAEHDGYLNVSGMNLISDTEEKNVAVYFAEPGLMANVTAGVADLPNSSYQLTAYTPIYEYNVHYVYDDGEWIHYGDDTYDASGSSLISDEGGYFVFTKNGETPGSSTGDTDDTEDHLRNYNPAVLAPEIAMAGVYRAMGMMFEYNFEHSDYYMKMPEKIRLAQKEEEEKTEEQMAAEQEAKLQEYDPTTPQYYNRYEMTETGAWFRGFASNEKVKYQQGIDSRDKYYGGMFGFDTRMNIHDNGWASVFTGYAGTLGIRQTYDGGHIKQHGGFLGATASFYKKNFYTAWTIAGGTMKAHEHTMYGKDKERIDNYGVAARIGYNFDFGSFTLLPTFTASYSYIHPEDFTSAADVHFTGSGFRAVQLNPNIKLIFNMKEGWQPYLTVGEVWTVGASSHVTATWAGQSHKLVALDFDPYTEYGIGVQKRWANKSDAYIQVLGHSHSRDGILINGGVRWNF